LAGEDETVRTWVRRELTELRRLRLEVRGADLLERGHVPGPAIGEALRATLDARLDGSIAAEGELDHALEWLSQREPAARRQSRTALASSGGRSA